MRFTLRTMLVVSLLIASAARAQTVDPPVIGKAPSRPDG